MEYTPKKKKKKTKKMKKMKAKIQEEICLRQKAQSESLSSLVVSFTEKPTTDVSVYKLITETRSLARYIAL